MTLTIKPILCRKGTMDNYAYVITDEASKKTAIIDASEAEPIIDYCQEKQLHPSFILTTHHHFDHVGGNLALKEKYGLQIIASEIEKDLIEGVDIVVKDKDVLSLGETKFTTILAPGHTKGHILWYFADDRALFTGDVLFNLSIGGLFEGTPDQMFDSLNKIKQLPKDINFYPGHEYTQYGLQSLLSQDSDEANQYYNIALSRLQQNEPVAPISLGLEKACNPYLKIDNIRAFSRLF